MNNIFYSIYVCEYKEGTEYKDIESIIEKAGATNNAYVKDLSDASPEERIHKLNAIISAEKIRSYTPSEADFYLVFIRTSIKGSYFVMLSVTSKLEQSTAFKRLYNVVFAFREKAVFSLYAGKNSLGTDKEYWTNVISKNSAIGEKEILRSSDVVMERFPMDEELQNLLGEAIETRRKSVKTIILSELGRLICLGAKEDRIVIYDVHDGGKLSLAPVFIDRYLDREAGYESVKKQLVGIEHHDMCTDEQLRLIGREKLSNTPAVTSLFITDNKYDYFLSSMEKDVVYHLGAIMQNDIPFHVLFSLCKGDISITYVYDEKLLRKLSLEEIHKNLCKMLKNNLLGAEETDVPVISDQTEDVNKQRAESVKYSVLRRIRMFSSYADDEVRQLARSFEVLYKREEQTVYNVGTSVDTLCIPVSGKLEVFGLNKSEQRPLYLIKQGDVFGIEGLFEDTQSSVGYKVISSDSVILTIDIDTFKQEARIHPEVYAYLLEIQSERLNKFERLWMTI